jgi:hypothetical protein
MQTGNVQMHSTSRTRTICEGECTIRSEYSRLYIEYVVDILERDTTVHNTAGFYTEHYQIILALLKMASSGMFCHVVW